MRAAVALLLLLGLGCAGPGYVAGYDDQGNRCPNVKLTGSRLKRDLCRTKTNVKVGSAGAVTGIQNASAQSDSLGGD